MTRLLRSTWFICAVALLAIMAPAVARAQAVITGHVQSEQGQPLNANVLINELRVSVATDQAGNFTITIPAARISGQTVVIRARAIGFQPATSSVILSSGRHTVSFNLRRDVTQLSEVVVTGVTTATEQIKVPFTVARLDTTQMPVQGSNPITQLQGKIPGALIVSGSGRPGSSPSVILRGPVSLNATGRSQQPLYMIDGIPLQGGLPDINPADIENVEVLKGAAAASLYGARAGAGVINITTKSGKTSPQGVKFGFRTEAGAGDIERRYPLARFTILAMDPTGHYFCTREISGGSPCARLIDWDQEVKRINNSGEDFALPPQLFKNDFGLGSGIQDAYNQLTGVFQATQWPHNRDPVGAVVTPSAYSNSNIDMRGKVNNTSIYASLGNSIQQGAVAFLNGYRRNSARANIDQRFGEKVTATINTLFSQTRDDAANFDETSGTAGTWFNLTRNPYMTDVMGRDALGRIYIRSDPLGQGAGNLNPVYPLAYYKRTDRGTRFVGGTTVRWSALNWLNLDGTLGYDRAQSIYKQFRDKGWRTASSAPSTSGGFLALGNEDDEQYNTSVNAVAQHTWFTDLNATFSSRFTYYNQTIRTQDESGSPLVVGGVETLAAVGPTTGVTTETKSIANANQTIRDMGFFYGADFDWKDRYVFGGLVRRDGSSLFGAGNRWQTFGRISGAWIVSREPWWPGGNALSLFKLRASNGSTGQRPRFNAQYEVFTFGTGGTLNPSTIGNRNLKPEINRETEIGGDFEFFNRYGLSVSYAKAKIDNQILPVKAPTATGFSSQWFNSGMITNGTGEATLTVPIITRGSMNWSSRVIWDQTRSTITRLNVPEFVGTIQPGPSNTFDIFKFRQGERIGTVYGFDFVRRCDQLQKAFQSQCSMNVNDLNAAYRPNSDGFLVWLGAGNLPTEGITKNLWRASSPLGSGPWGNELHWGMPIALRYEDGTNAFNPLGSGLPKYHWGLSQNMDYKRFNVYGLLDSYQGQKLWNTSLAWSLADFTADVEDQYGKAVTDAKPAGYYWRRGPSLSPSPGSTAGIGGLYDVLNPNGYNFEDASYIKLREMSVSYRLGEIGGAGDWKVGFVGRNLHTWTKFRGFDPESGNTTGPFNSSALTPTTGYRFPNLRTYTVQLSTAF